MYKIHEAELAMEIGPMQMHEIQMQMHDHGVMVDQI